MKNPYGQFTVYGDDAVEELISSLVDDVRRVFASTIPDVQYRALVLLGGYGRGEGGVETRDGVQRPHNNLDFLLITRPAWDNLATAMRARISEELGKLESTYGVGIDFSSIPEKKLLHSPCLVMWYDMRFGHKTVLGDREFVSSLTRYSVDRIEPLDVLWLLVNRGSQLIVNDLLLARDRASETELRYVVRLSVKAIIGYGDALLFFLNQYHWSYQEKGRRMAELNSVPLSFRRLYAEAVEFRFRPNYGTFLDRNLVEWMNSTRKELEGIHRECESRRLGVHDWSWDDYPSLNLRHDLWNRPLSVRRTGRKLVNVIKGSGVPGMGGWIDKLAVRAAGRRGLLPACYPAVVYRLESPKLRDWTREMLGARDSTDEALGLAFLGTWGRYVDQNFFKASRKLGLPLESAGGVV